MTNPDGRTATTFAQCLAAFRCKRGLSQNRLAIEAEFDHGYISRLEAGKRGPSRETVAVLVEAMRLDRWDAARLYRAAGYWPPSVVAAYFVAADDMETLTEAPPGARLTLNLDWVGLSAVEEHIT